MNGGIKSAFNLKSKQTSILIEVVSNGFVVHEDHYNHGRPPSAEATTRKVYNTHEQLCKYIEDNL